MSLRQCSVHDLSNGFIEKGIYGIKDVFSVFFLFFFSFLYDCLRWYKVKKKKTKKEHREVTMIFVGAWLVSAHLRAIQHLRQCPPADPASTSCCDASSAAAGTFGCAAAAWGATWDDCRTDPCASSLYPRDAAKQTGSHSRASPESVVGSGNIDPGAHSPRTSAGTSGRPGFFAFYHNCFLFFFFVFFF